jgi:hypothetical protein
MPGEDSKSNTKSKNLLALIILYVLLPLAIVVSVWGIVIIHKYNFLCWNGTDIDHYPSGEKMLESNYRGGLLHGTQIRYYPNGLMMYEKNFVKGQLHGLLRSWDAKGKIIDEIPYARGDRHGVSRCYDESGNLSSEDTYVNEKRVKTVQYVRDPNQGHTVSFEGYYKNGRPESGQFVRYSAVKKSLRVYTYEKGEFVTPKQTPPKDME